MPTSAQDAEQPSIVDQERDIMNRTVVSVFTDSGETRVAKLNPAPVFRYGDEAQKIGDSTIWVWMDEGRPVAIQKIEINRYLEPVGWTYCFCALSDRLVEVEWPNVDRTYKSRKPVEFKPFPDAPVPVTKARWPLQARALSRKFSASQVFLDRSEQLRLIPQPIVQYASTDNGILAGYVYGLATGTNPSIFIIIELRKTDEGPVWHCGSARATANEMRLTYGQAELRSEGREDSPGQFPTWTYLWMSGE